jgi:hypothetical protein
MSTVTETPPTTTRRGTPSARSWGPDWIARVEEREETLDRRICGARTIGHAPCPAPSTHPSGRCGHHGGFDLTGAPEGNRNAVVHNLYARRLMPCGNHCPAWRSCPLGGGAADNGKEMLARPPVDRPTCPFEQAEYTAVVTDAMRRTQNHHANAWGLHLAHQIALMTVLVSRAARFLATHPFTDTVETIQGEQRITTDKPAAALIAYEKLARELRRWTILLERSYEWISCDPQTNTHHAQRQTTDTAPDPDSLAATATAPALRGAGFQPAMATTAASPKSPLASAPPAQSTKQTDPSDPSNPWLNQSPCSPPPTEDPELQATRERINGYIKNVFPDLLKPLKTSDPPGSGLQHLLDPPLE